MRPFEFGYAIGHFEKSAGLGGAALSGLGRYLSLLTGGNKAKMLDKAQQYFARNAEPTKIIRNAGSYKRISERMALPKALQQTHQQMLNDASTEGLKVLGTRVGTGAAGLAGLNALSSGGDKTAAFPFAALSRLAARGVGASAQLPALGGHYVRHLGLGGLMGARGGMGLGGKNDAALQALMQRATKQKMTTGANPGVLVGKPQGPLNYSTPNQPVTFPRKPLPAGQAVDMPELAQPGMQLQ